MIRAGGDGHNLRESIRHIATGKPIRSPRNHRAVALQGQSVIPIRGNGHDTVQSGRNIELAFRIVAPGDNGAVRPERDLVPASTPIKG